MTAIGTPYVMAIPSKVSPGWTVYCWKVGGGGDEASGVVAPARGGDVGTAVAAVVEGMEAVALVVNAGLGVASLVASAAHETRINAKIGRAIRPM
jgi:hypothetical protein